MNSDLEFCTPKDYPKSLLGEVQKRLLEMADIVTGILTKNRYNYIITFGTLLGAIRHNGFIPWDDDFDIFIFENDYDAAIECIRKELPENYIVHDRKNDSNYWPSWSRVRDLKSYTESTLFPDDNHYKYRGINLDLYKLEMVQKNLIRMNVCRERLRYYSVKYNNGVIEKEEYFNMLDFWSNELAKEINGSRNSEDSRIMYYWKYLYDIELEYKDIFPLKLYSFEGKNYYGPNNYDKLLKQSYNDYMKLPDIEKRKPHYSKVIIY